jgi:molybdopterin synthase catalytic subunit
VVDEGREVERSDVTGLAPGIPGDADWIEILAEQLPVDAAWKASSLPGCGAVVTFFGTVRDHSEGRSDVTALEYEVYEEYVIPRLRDVASAARTQWPEIGRLVLLHRVGRLEVGEVAVVVAASTPHRAEAFAAAQFCIDTLKHTVPIWKRETWSGGSDWSVCSEESDSAARPPRDAPDHRMTGADATRSSTGRHQ